MKRSGPPKRKKPLASGHGLDRSSGLTRTPIAKQSKKKARERAERSKVVAGYAARGVRCEIGPVLAAANVYPLRCVVAIQGLHERRKRSSAGVLGGDNVIPACNWCNGWVEDNPDDARGFGLVIREGDPDWERFGRRDGDATAPPIRLCLTCGADYIAIPPCGHPVAPDATRCGERT